MAKYQSCGSSSARFNELFVLRPRVYLSSDYDAFAGFWRLVEDSIKRLCPGISNAMMVGDKRKFNVCLVTLKTKVAQERARTRTNENEREHEQGTNENKREHEQGTNENECEHEQ